MEGKHLHLGPFNLRFSRKSSEIETITHVKPKGRLVVQSMDSFALFKDTLFNHLPQFALEIPSFLRFPQLTNKNSIFLLLGATVVQFLNFMNFLIPIDLECWEIVGFAIHSLSMGKIYLSESVQVWIHFSSLC